MSSAACTRCSSTPLEQGGAPRSVSLDRALEGDILLLPLPVCRGDRLNLPLTDTELELRRLWPRLRYDQLLLGGMTGNLGPRLMADYGLMLVDYYAREETQVRHIPSTLQQQPGQIHLPQVAAQNGDCWFHTHPPLCAQSMRGEEKW